MGIQVNIETSRADKITLFKTNWRNELLTKKFNFCRLLDMQ